MPKLESGITQTKLIRVFSKVDQVNVPNTLTNFQSPSKYFANKGPISLYYKGHNKKFLLDMFSKCNLGNLLIVSINLIKFQTPSSKAIIPRKKNKKKKQKKKQVFVKVNNLIYPLSFICSPGFKA